jgi:rare lipoprotein A
MNDRGPFVGDRLIDLSRRAAQILGFTDQGTTKVRVQALDKNGKVLKSQQRYATNTVTNDIRAMPIIEEKVEQTIKAPLVIQAGSFRLKDNAQSRLQELKSAGISARITEALVNGVIYFRIIIGGFSSQGGAEGALEQIQARGFYDARIIANQ